MRRLWIWRKHAYLPCLAASIALFAACSDTVSGSDANPADASSDAAFDAKDGNSNKLDAVDAADQLTNDAPDVTDDAADADVKGPDCMMEPGAPQCPCQDNSTCDVPICLPTAQGAQCAKPCIENCPEGFKCIGVAGQGGDIQPVCVDKWPHLCDPCANSAQCGAVGLQAPACVDAGKDGHFCGTACKADSDCPGGYSCASVKSVEGNDVQQCQPTAGATCTCSPSAIADQLSTACFAEAKDDKGAVIGQCKGVRACGPTGLSACNASPQTETCNGQDDNCNGLVDEGTCDDKNPCTLDQCDAIAQTCNHSNSPGSCDADGNNCTVGDACVEGKCVIGALKSCDDGNPCTTDACDPAKGCTKSDDNGLPCSDGSACTVGDACTGGACVSGALKNCPDGDACKSWTCNDTSGKCEQSAKPDGTGCSDGTACTSADVCTGGSCAGTPVDCDDKNPCTLDTCDPLAQCKHAVANTPCDDGNACTTGDSCTPSLASAKCLGTPINIVTECGDGNPCTTDTCDKIAGCVYLANAAPCSDGNACTAGDVCANSACKAGTTVVCGCQTDGDCVDDGNLCNGTLYCDANKQCKVNPASIKTCDTSGDGPCSQTTCDTATGACIVNNLPDGKACDADGTVCTPNDACASGTCVAGALKSCNDNNVCTDDACDSIKGCVNTANVSACNVDDNACTVNDTCSGKSCLAGPLKSCVDTNDCTQDACNQTTGDCVFDAAPNVGKPCDDGNICTVSDACAANGTCTPGAAYNCDDGNACTTDACGATTGCGHTTLADKTTCATGKWCIAGACVKSPNCGDGAVDPGEQCDDGASNGTAGDPCTTGCQYVPATTPKQGDLLITEIMFHSNYYYNQQSSFENEWFELYNNSQMPLVLTGLHFQDSNANAVELPTLASGDPWILLPGAYTLLALGTDIGNYTPAWTYGSAFAFANSGDAACISGPSDTACKTDIIAKVTYTSTAPISNGHSATLRKSKYATAYTSGGTLKIDNLTTWCNSGKPIAGETLDYGTPGFADSNCL